MRMLPISIAFAVTIASISGASIAMLFETVNAAFFAIASALPR